MGHNLIIQLILKGHLRFISSTKTFSTDCEVPKLTSKIDLIFMTMSSKDIYDTFITFIMCSNNSRK